MVKELPRRLALGVLLSLHGHYRSPQLAIRAMKGSNTAFELALLTLHQWRDIDGYVHAVTASAEEDTFDRADVVIVATPTEGDVAQARNAIVGGIEIDPAGRTTVNADPGMARVGAYQLWLTNRWIAQ